MNNILLSYKSIISRSVKPFLLGLMLSLSTFAHAGDEAVCAPFKNAQIDQSKLTMMLNAAKDGDLYRIKPGTSKMGFCVNSPVGVIKAEFHEFKGGLPLEEEKEQGRGKGNIVFDTLKGGHADERAVLKGERVFSCERFASNGFFRRCFVGVC